MLIVEVDGQRSGGFGKMERGARQDSDDKGLEGAPRNYATTRPYNVGIRASTLASTLVTCLMWRSGDKMEMKTTLRIKHASENRTN